MARVVASWISGDKQKGWRKEVPKEASRLSGSELEEYLGGEEWCSCSTVLWVVVDCLGSGAR